MLPFPLLVLAIAVLPMVVPKWWEHRWFQALAIALVSTPVIVMLVSTGRVPELAHTTTEYVSFIATIGALFVAAGGVYAIGDLEATPATNVAFLVGGALLASAIGTTGASVLIIRPLLRTNAQRQHTAHLVPFFILAVANAGGLLTPLGDPPLLIGFIQGVPFFWTFRLLPVWILYVGSFAIGLYIADKRAYAKETAAALTRDRSQATRLHVQGAHNLLWLIAIIGAAFLRAGFREVAMVGIALASYFGTRREVHQLNQFSLAPIIEVALIFIGLFVCLVPIESGLAAHAEALPLHSAWQLFWVSGALSSLLDNAPTYAAFTSLARGLSVGHDNLVAGVLPMKLAAVSIGSVVMGGTTYIGNGPNLIMKSIAEKAGYVLPSFARFAIFAFAAMLPAHVIITGVLAFLDH